MQHRRHAGVGASEVLRPLVAARGGEAPGEALSQELPSRRIELVGEFARVQIEPVQELRVDVRLQCTTTTWPRPELPRARAWRRSAVTHDEPPNGAPVAALRTAAHDLEARVQQLVGHRSHEK
jgi:hypothetical protein